MLGGMLKVRFCIITAIVSLFLGAFAHAQVIYQDDFEGTVSGWSNNSTEFDPDVTRFLGRFDDSPNSTSRTFTMPANTSQLVIEFDLYRFDSWDDSSQYGYDRFQVDIDGVQIFSLPMPNPQAARSGTTGNVDWSHTPTTGTVELAFGTGQWWFDQIHRFTIVVNNPGATVDLTLRTAINQGGNDESGGFDNITVIAVAPNPSLLLVKSADDTTERAAGENVIYTYTVTNDGDQNISGITVTDAHNASGPVPVPGAEAILNDVPPLNDSSDAGTDGTWDLLAPGDSITFTGTYTVTQNDVDTLQ